MTERYEPVWYKATTKEPLMTPSGTIPVGQKVYWTPSSDRGWIIVFDNGRKVRVLAPTEVDKYLGQLVRRNPQRDSWAIDRRYTEAALAQQEAKHQ